MLSAVFTFLGLAALATASPMKRSINGPVISANFPDPSILYDNGVYYAYSTTSGGKNVPMYTSGDFVNWSPVSTDALPNVGAWAVQYSTWAPDVIKLGTNKYLMYYSSAVAGNTKYHCIGAATASNPQGPFQPVSTVLQCDISAGGSIDPDAFIDSDGSLYMIWKIDGNNIGHGGNCNNGVAPLVPTPIMIRKMSADGLSFASGSSAIQLLDRGDADGPLIEAPSMVRSSSGTYFLFFSSNCYSGSLYDIAYATASSVTGPFTKGPWLMITGSPFSNLYSPGGADVTPDGTKLVFHADQGTSVNVRQMYTASISLSGTKVNI